MINTDPNHKHKYDAWRQAALLHEEKINNKTDKQSGCLYS
jgi:hypothetical protein